MLHYITFYIMPFAAIMWSFIFLFFDVVGIRMFRVKGAKLNMFMSKIKHASMWLNSDPDGWIVGWPFFGYIHTIKNGNEVTQELFLLTTKHFHKKNINKEENSKRENTITFYEREGSFWNIEYTNRQLTTSNKPTKMQKGIIKRIIDDYNKKDYSIPLLYGEPGTGKSMLSILFCIELLKSMDSIMMVDTFNPTDPGDTFIKLYDKLNPTSTKPLVVIFEEVDIIIQKLHNNDIKRHDSIPVQIKNKAEWNSFFDRFDRKLYPYVILIMTTNKSIDYFNTLDTSYLRDGRTTMKIHVEKHK